MTEKWQNGKTSLLIDVFQQLNIYIKDVQEVRWQAMENTPEAEWGLFIANV